MIDWGVSLRTSALTVVAHDIASGVLGKPQVWLTVAPELKAPAADSEPPDCCAIWGDCYHRQECPPGGC